MLGLMQDCPLTVDRIIDHAARWHGEREVVSRSIEGPIVRTNYRQIRARAKRVSNVLLNLGIKPGDRVATMAWNTARHLEVWYGIMGIGAVCHTLNPRLFAEQLCYIINHAQDRVIFTDLTFLPVLLQNRDKMPSVEAFVLLTDEAHMDGAGEALCYETLLAPASEDCAWGGFDENTACGLCYTSGTTGNPKGVLYSHRSNFLHTLVTMGIDVLQLSARETVMPIVPMFHANAWGMAFSGPAAGAKLVLPGAQLDAPSVYELITSEGVTYAGAVPTVWQTLLAYLRETGAQIPTLKKTVIGGSAVPEAMVRTFRDDYGVEVTHAWGMTETSPLGTIAAPNGAVAAMDPETQLKYRLKQGRPPICMNLKLVDEAGRELPHDGKTFGHLKVQGPFVVREYFKSETGSALDADGWFDTGDVSTIDDQGYMQITDRAKDVIKSGGEWISSIEIENLAAGHPDCLIAAVVGVPHPKWDERPLLLVKPKPGSSLCKADMLAFLEGKIARWWTPDEVLLVDDIPLGATGKIDKKLIREQYKDYVLPDVAGFPGPQIGKPPQAPAKPEEAAAGAERPFPAEPARRAAGALGTLAALAVVGAGVIVGVLLRRR